MSTARTGWRGKAIAATLSLALSVGAAELAARAWHRGAYPLLNLFERDARYGVRLRPSATTRVRSRGGTVTEIATNALGFRGPAWRAAAADRPVDGRVLLLGDSQMFGYGVPFERSIAVELERAIGGDAEVLDAAVPTWGPPEYLSALHDLGPIYRPRVVVFVANAANDWFEARAANPLRTGARDGWAVRATGDGDRITRFPGRDFLFGRSHLVLAVRQLMAHAISDGEAPPAEAATQLLHDLPALARRQDGHRSRLTPALLEAVARCRALGCTVVAVALPLDVQVDPREWKKYRARPSDLAATEQLLTDFVADARDAGLPAIDLTAVLRAASPGAFLADDYHLSARGHLAIAQAIAPLCRAAAVAADHTLAEVNR